MNRLSDLGNGKRRLSRVLASGHLDLGRVPVTCKLATCRHWAKASFVTCCGNFDFAFSCKICCRPAAAAPSQSHSSVHSLNLDDNDNDNVLVLFVLHLATLGPLIAVARN